MVWDFFQFTYTQYTLIPGSYHNDIGIPVKDFSVLMKNDRWDCRKLKEATLFDLTIRTSLLSKGQG